MDALDHANHDGKGNGMRPPVGDERQWDARNGRNSHGHANVLEALPQNHGEYAGTEQGT